MPTPHQLLAVALSQDGDRYIFGHEASPSDSNPNAFDCSELVEWACYRIGVSPRVPDGSWYQAQHVQKHNLLRSINMAIASPGALLFSFRGDPWGRTRPAAAHVAISQGNGLTIEARSTRHGVGVFSAHNRGWTHAGLIPGIDYKDATMPDENLKDQEKVPLLDWARPTFAEMIDRGEYTEQTDIDKVSESYEMQQVTVNTHRAIRNAVRDLRSELAAGGGGAVDLSGLVTRTEFDDHRHAEGTTGPPR